MTSAQGPRAVPGGGSRPGGAPPVIVLAISGPVAGADLPGLCRDVGSVLEWCSNGALVCDVRALVEPDAATVDVLARLQLLARRRGRAITLRHACLELRDLIAWMGLDEALPQWRALPAELGLELEQGEESGGVEEERDPGDEPA